MEPHEPLARERRILEILSALSYRSGELSTYLDAIARGVSELVQVDWSVVTLYIEPDQDRILASSMDIGEAADKTYSLHGSVTANVVDQGCTVMVEDAEASPDAGSMPEGYRAYLGVPLRTAAGRVLGTVCSFHREPRHFSPEQVEVAELFAERAATALDNYQLYRQQQAFSESLEAEVERRTEELRTAQERLVEQERLAAIGEFAAGIVHEVRNPLTVIAMALGHLRKLELAEPARKRIDLAQGEAARLERLLEEILLYAREQRVSLVPVGLNLLVNGLADSLRALPSATERELCLETPPSETLALGDADKLKQVLINLVSNALEASPPGGQVRCSVEVLEGRPALEVHNGGEPIPAGRLARLTEPFYSTKPNGTGLGLAIVRRIVEAHGGRLEFDSREGLGTVVRVLLQGVESNQGEMSSAS